MGVSPRCATALITGASGGVGSVLVDHFQREGMKVAAAVRDAGAARAALKGSGSSPVYVEADVTDEAGVRTLMAEAVRRLGSVDLVVNTVGGYLPETRLEDLDASAWDRMMTINLRSAFLCTREAIRMMRPERRGIIVNFSAMVGLDPSPGRIAYAVSKAGIAILTRVVAEELHGSGIFVYAIAPGTVATDANKTWGSADQQAHWVTPQEIAEMILRLARGRGSPSGSVIAMGDRP